MTTGRDEPPDGSDPIDDDTPAPLPAPAPSGDEGLLTRTVGSAEAGLRLDKALHVLFPRRSRAALQRQLADGSALLNGRDAKPSQKVAEGDTVTVGTPAPRPLELVPEPGPLFILYEDEWMLALDKQAGIPMHPGTGHATGSLANRLVALGRSLSHGGSWERPGIVHRLDRDTTGVVLVAKDDGIHAALSAQFEARTVRKTYAAFVSGVPNPPRQVVSAGIMRNKRQPELMQVGPVPPARSAETEIVVQSQNGRIALVECRPRTGRTHQIRVHAMHIGHPLVGDTAYGGPLEIRRAERERGPLTVTRPMLHARSISFTHPAKGQVVSLTAPWPEDFVETARETGLELPQER